MVSLLLVSSPLWFKLAVFYGITALGLVALFLLWQGLRGHRYNQKVEDTLERYAKNRGTPDQQSRIWRNIREQRSQQQGILGALIQWVPQREQIELMLERAGREWSISKFLVLTGCVGGILGGSVWIITRSVPLALTATLLGTLIIPFKLKREAKKRREAFEQGFPEAIQVLARSIKSGQAFSHSLRIASEEVEDPVSSELRKVFEQQRYGLPMKECLLNFAERVDLMDVRMFVTAVLVQREAGGNLVENLEKLGDLIRKRFQFRRRVRAETAKGRITGYILAAAPILAAGGMSAFQPGYMMRMFEEPLGRALLGLALLFQIIGFFVIRRITNIEL